MKKKNTQIDNTKYIDIVMPMYNLIQYSDNHSKTSESLWQYYRDQLDLNDVGAVAKFSAAKNNSASFKLKQKITGKTADGGAKIEIIVPLKYLGRF